MDILELSFYNLLFLLIVITILKSLIVLSMTLYLNISLISAISPRLNFSKFSFYTKYQPQVFSGLHLPNYLVPLISN